MSNNTPICNRCYFSFQVLRVQSKSGRFPLNGLHSESTLSELQKVLKEVTKLPPDSQKSGLSLSCGGREGSL